MNPENQPSSNQPPSNQPPSSPKRSEPTTSNLANSAFSLPREQLLPYGSSLLDAGNFQVVAFADAIIGTPTGDLSRFPKTDLISVAGTVALPGISKDEANVYARKFYGDRTVLKAQEEVLVALKVLENLHQKILEKEVGKVGLRNLRISPTGEMLCDVERVPFAAYGHFATKGCSEAHFNAGGATGVCMILLTADDQIVVQKRSAKNRFFGGIPGASIAGLVDYKLNRDGRITTESIIDRARIEGIEELGVRGHEIVDIAMTGVLFEVAKPHHEVAFVGKTTLTAAEIRSRVKSNLTSSTATALPFDFAEKAFTVPNTPTDLITLVAECRAPMPSTHAGALVTAAYHLIAKQQGPEAAQAWAADIGEKCREYYRSLDAQVAEYYQSDRSRYFEIPKRFTADYSRKISTGELEQVTDTQLTGFLPKCFDVRDLSPAERLSASAMYLGVIPKRNIEAYEPGLLPEEQGLPSLSSELNRLGYERLH